MQEFMEYCVETDPDCPLPPPKAAAKNLKESALRAIQQWQNKFGKAYKKLTLGYNFLKFQKKVRIVKCLPIIAIPKNACTNETFLSITPSSMKICIPF